MPDSVTSNENFFYQRIEAVCKGPLFTCPPDMDVVAAARLMQENDLTAVVVVAEGNPLGVFSIRDLRNCLADSDGIVAGCKVRDNMGQGLITINRRDYVFEAVFKMARHNIFRLGVVDDRGTLVGIVSATDLLKVQTCTPLFLYQEIREADSIHQLRALGARIHDVIKVAIHANSDILNIVQLISRFNDAISIRLIALLEQNEGIRLPEGAAYLVLGSEGRGEQTLRTDQDNAIVYRDDLPPEKLREVKRFATRLVDALEEIGVPRCPGNIMASTPRWRHSLSEWKQLVNRWISVPTPEHVLNFGMFQDLRSQHGDEDLVMQLREHIRVTVQHNAYFLTNMASHVVRFPPPFTMLKRIRLENSGEHKGQLDLKKAGLFAITTGSSLLALEFGIIGGSTCNKLEQLAARKFFSKNDHETIREAFAFLTRLRLQQQLREQLPDGKATHHIDPQILSKRERNLLLQALEGVNVFLWIFREHYLLDYMSA